MQTIQIDYSIVSGHRVVRDKLRKPLYTYKVDPLETETVKNIEGAKITVPKNQVLERYFNDIYKLFIVKLTRLAMGNGVDERELKKMKELFSEIVRVKGLLECSQTGE
jgi:hypothetical protein